MVDPDLALQEHVAVLADVASRIPGGTAGLTCARDTEVVQLLSAAQAVVLSAQGILAAAAGEISRRSESGGEASLARRLGASSARGLIASEAQIPLGEASRLVDVGQAVRPRTALSGEDLPAQREHIAAAVLGGRLSLQLAVLIDATIDTVASHLAGGTVQQFEAALVRDAISGEFSVSAFTAYCKSLPNLLDPDGAKPRDEHLRDKASVKETKLSNGMLRIVAELDPESAAYYLAAMRAKTNPRRSDAGTGDSGDGSNVTRFGDRGDRTQPTPARSKLDAFISIMRGALKADNGDQAGVDTTILVRMTMQDLLSGLGTATIDGIETPISASAARRMAAEADLIPQVFGGDSVLLDQGQSKRRFTRAQRYAILGMYAGCAFPKCDIPSSMVELHHVGRWASRDEHRCGTDLLNGLPLCGFHNRLMEQGWEIVFDDDRVPWFIPPPTVDARQRPRRGGNLAHPNAA